MAIIEVVKYDGPPGVFAWKHPDQELGTWTQLIVNESQEAVLFKGGQALDSFTAGRHTLSTANIPVLSHIVNLPFGGKSPFTAEVWFVNKLNSMNVKWGTSSPLQLQDPKYNIMVSLRSYGQFGVRIEDARKFLLKLVGSLPQFDQETLVSYFRGLLMSNINELISSYLIRKKISVLEINAYVVEISRHIQGRLAPVFLENGIELNHFYIDSINIPEDDPAVLTLKEALAKRAEMDIIGYTYQQERSFDTLEESAGNPGNLGAGMMNAGLGLGMGFGLAGPAADIVSQMSRGIGQSGRGAGTGISGKACPDCGEMSLPSARFCSGCGKGFRAAGPEEGAEDTVVCRSCSSRVAAGARFCTNCGNSMTLKCAGCGHELEAGQRFCGECGRQNG
ncbi:SPFH domain-containing protein [Paenibacillus sp. FSL R7-0331]|uniref:SPFH domain-containing protein n=1 Tax=Paenibacillus sp. FSL R7-0331 TaxID=1536773 RepID=UPI0004F625B7|nr:SPFH domain-containing protein [Paenibacillus sp. FSL R7-0331]AIQ54385.1 antifreeze protein type I [Paenibacillus sp. FSL R7-0331]